MIGRAESCDIGLFGDSTVERTHARILRRAIAICWWTPTRRPGRISTAGASTGRRRCVPATRSGWGETRSASANVRSGRRTPLFYEAPDERRNLIRSHIESKVAAVDNVYLSIWHVPTIGLRL